MLDIAGLIGHHQHLPGYNDLGVAGFFVANARDARQLGPRFISRHFMEKIAHRRLTHTVIRGVGQITLRNGTSDAQVFSQVFTDNQYELSWYPQYADVIAYYNGILAAGLSPLIIDLGANNGASALWFRTRFPDATIVAVEPDPTNSAICRENTAHHSIEVVDAAIGSDSGTVDLITEGREKWAISTERSDHGAVPICTINDIIVGHPTCRLFMVKIDIEGFESDLFAAHTDWVEHAKVIMIEPHDYLVPGSSREFQAVIGSLDFDLLISNENLMYVRRPLTPARALEPDQANSVVG